MRIFGACVIELHPRAVTALCLALSLSACGIGGMWMNGDPSVSRTLVPPRDTWQKMGNDGAARDADWRECGVGPPMVVTTSPRLRSPARR